MNIETFREHCLAKKGVSEETPFGPDALVYKVMGKMFALTSLNSEVFSFSVKCDPDKALELREAYTAVRPGYHMNKTHWNTIIPDFSVGDILLKAWIDHSYHLVVSALPKKVQQEFQSL